MVAADEGVAEIVALSCLDVSLRAGPGMQSQNPTSPKIGENWSTQASSDGRHDAAYIHNARVSERRRDIGIPLVFGLTISEF